MPAKDRVSYIDIFKGIGIILMIMGHVDFGLGFNNYIHSFHMPMFFFISGFLFRDLNFNDFFKRKFNSLIIPYLQFGIFNLIMCAIFMPDYGAYKYLKLLFLYNNRGLPICGALWFLTGLFFANILFYFAKKYIKKYFLCIFLIIIVSVLYCTKIPLPFSIDCAIYMLPIMYAGYIFKKLIKDANLSDKQQILAGIFLLVTFSLIIFYVDNGCEVMGNRYPYLPLFYTNAIPMCIGFFYLSKWLDKYKPSKAFEYIGRNSLNFMCLNQIAILIISKLNIPKYAVFILTIAALAIVNELLKFPYFAKFSSKK